MAASDLVPFKIGEASPANTFFAIYMADAAGLFEINGLDFRIVKMVGGSETGPALSEGRIQLMHIGMSSVVRANAAGFNVVTIGSLSNVIRSTLFAAPGITSVDQIKGGIVGISSTGSESELSTVVALQKLGLSRNDVTLKEIGTLRLPYIRNGDVAASMLGEPYRSEAYAEGIHAISDMLADRIPWLYSGLVVDKAYLSTHRDAIRRAMRAIVEGNYLAVSDPDRAKEIMAKALNITDRKNLDITYDNFRTYTPLNAEVTRAGGEAIIATVDAPGASRNLDDYMDESIHEELKAEGFFAAMAQKYGVS
jgi:ABC-type nitrate/sulfonate/bicarbonate transport system substrate-binding protein